MGSLIDARDMIQVDNHATRIPVVLCLDTSGSMGSNGGYQALNEGVKAFYETCKEDPINRFGFDVAIVTFGGDGVTKYQDFRPIWNQEDIPRFSKPENGPQGTPMGQAVDKAMKGLQTRKDEYKANAISYYQPFLVIITDGQSTEIMPGIWPDGVYRENCKAFEAAKAEILELQRRRKLKVIAIGVGNEDYSELANFVIDKKVLLAKDFSAFDLVFEFMSKSMSNSAAHDSADASTEESPITQIMEDLEDEGIVSISIEDFGRDED